MDKVLRTYVCLSVTVDVSVPEYLCDGSVEDEGDDDPRHRLWSSRAKSQLR